LLLQDPQVRRGELRARCHRPSACTTPEDPVPHACRRDTAYYKADGNGNITALINSAQRVVANYLYDPYGNLLTQRGPLAEANLYRFSSKEAHLSGLIYYLYRYYDPSFQRWLNNDPIKEAGGINLSAFCRNSPIVRRDAFGLFGLGAAPDSITFMLLHCAAGTANFGLITGRLTISKDFGLEGMGDFVTCFCTLAPDSPDCERKLGPCLGLIKNPTSTSVCACLCYSLGSAAAIEACVEACKTGKKFKQICKDHEIEL